MHVTVLKKFWSMKTMNRVRWKTRMQGKRNLPRWTIHEQFFQKATLHDTEHLHKGLMWPREWQENRTLVQKPVDRRKMAGFRNDNNGLKGEKAQLELEKCTEDQHSSRLAVQETGTKPQVWWRISGEVTSQEGYELTQRLLSSAQTHHVQILQTLSIARWCCLPDPPKFLFSPPPRNY